MKRKGNNILNKFSNQKDLKIIMKTYLVTGVAGFIGANFLKYILKKHKDINVIVVDSLTYAGNLGTIKEGLEGKKLPVYGKGDNVRDWLYVEDHCKGIDLVLRDAKVGEIYNIGGFNEEKNINIVKLVIDILKEEITNNDEYKKVLKTDLSNISYDLITYVQDRLGHDMRYAIDPSKIAKDLGWYPETDFETGIRKTVKWYLENQEWVNEVASGDYQKYYEEMYGGK